MAVVQNISIRGLTRGTPYVYVAGQLLSSTSNTIVNINDPLVRRDLHAHRGRWVVTGAGVTTPVAPDVHGAVTGLDTQTGATVTGSAGTQVTVGIQAGCYDSAVDRDTFITLLNALRTDYTKTVEDMNDLFATVVDLQAIVVQINAALLANGYLK